MAFNTEQPAYIALRDIIAERTRRTIAWVGSGASVEANLPTWSGLKQRLIDAGREKAMSMEEDSRRKQLSQLDSIDNEENPWIAFQRLKNSLGPTSYRDTIREALRISETIESPGIYKSLWKIGIRGIFNLNLDRLACKGHSEIFNGKNITEFQGKNIGEFSHVISSPQKFIANLHGIVENSSTWIFCYDDLKKLMRKDDYSAFIQTCLMSHTVIFIGITADDIAVGGHLERIKKKSIEIPTHFWVSNRRDNATDKWAESFGIRMVRYNDSIGTHEEIQEFFSDLINYCPIEHDAPPIFSSPKTSDYSDSILSPEELSELLPDEIRLHLNNHAAGILSHDPPDYEAYDEFCSQYDLPIYTAWYTSTHPPNNILLGWSLQKQEKTGAFGKLFKATDPEGKQVAVKVLREDIRKTPKLLRAFRRGVRSMRILERRNAIGMARYIRAYEIPTCVVMEWIEGPNLSDAVMAGAFSEWEEIIPLFKQLADYLYQAHCLPERVLHRDLRPSNVMIENMYTDPENQHIVLTDFDLSWHKGAFEDSVVHGSTMAGYLAPEQLSDIDGVSTRHSSVDSFGLGMTMYYVLSGKDPFPAQHRHAMWIEEINALCEYKHCAKWYSLPARINRLVIMATKDKQSARIDMGQLYSELCRLAGCLEYPNAVEFSELLAEEIAARCEHNYSWNEDSFTAEIEYANGITAKIIGNESDKRIEFCVEWSNTGSILHRNVRKYIQKLQDKMEPALEKAGWQRVQHRTKQGIFSINAEIPASIAVDDLDKYAKGISNCCSMVAYV